MPNLENKIRLGCISIYPECISRRLAEDICDLFKKYRELGKSRDGNTGGGVDKTSKDTLDICARWELPDGDPLRSLCEEAEEQVFTCILDYYRDNKGLLYGLSSHFSKTNAFTHPEVEFILPRINTFQRGQLQYYASESNGYTANHCESLTVEGFQADSDYRTLTWMMTLNDLSPSKEQWGYTCFTNQNIAVRPQAGQLVLFSPWLDCEHRGNPTNGEDKTIITSWMTKRQ